MSCENEGVFFFYNLFQTFSLFSVLFKYWLNILFYYNLWKYFPWHFLTILWTEIKKSLREIYNVSQIFSRNNNILEQTERPVLEYSECICNFKFAILSRNYDCLEKNIYYKASLILSVSSERWNDTRKTLKMKQYYNAKKLSISSSYFFR